MRFGGLIAAVVFAVFAAVVVLRMSGSSNDTAPAAAPAAESKSVNIYVATKPLSVGTTVAETDVGVQPWPQNLMLDGFVVADGKTNLVGMVTRAPLQQSEPITLSKVANPNDPNFLAGDLPKGMRIVTIPVNETDGVAGFVFPGDHVDLIYTHDVPKWEYPPTAGTPDPTTPSTPNKATTTVTETLLTNVKVAAIDQRSSGAGATDSKGNLLIPRSASLIVSAVDSQRVRLAQKTGSVTMVLRALADKESADPLVLTGAADVTQSKDDSNKAPQSGGDIVKIVRGAPNTQKDNATDASSVTRGAANVSGAAPGMGSPVGPLPSGGSVVTPGLAAF